MQTLDNMISKLEQRKKFKSVEVPQKAVIELLSYIKELKGKTEAVQSLQEALNSIQNLQEELITAVKKETVDKIRDYITNYNSLVYAYIPKEPLLEFLVKIETQENKKPTQKERSID